MNDKRIFLTDGAKVVELTEGNFTEHVQWVDVGPIQTSLGAIAERAYVVEAVDEEDARGAALKLLECAGMSTPEKVRVTGCTWGAIPVPGIEKSMVPFYRTPASRE